MVARLQATTVSCTRVSIYLSIYVDQVGKVSRCSVLGLGGGGGGGGRGERDDERETEPVMGEALRLFVFLFSLLGSLTGGWGWEGEAVEEEEGYTKYGGKEDDGVPREEEEAGEGAERRRGEQLSGRGWDEEFSLAFASMSLYARLLYGCGTYICLARARRAAKKSDRV